MCISIIITKLNQNCCGLKVRVLFVSTAFALELNIVLKHPAALLNHNSGIGRVESDFLTQLVTLEDVEAKADNCTKVSLCFLPTANGIVNFSVYNDLSMNLLTFLNIGNEIQVDLGSILLAQCSQKSTSFPRITIVCKSKMVLSPIALTRLH